MSASWIEYKNKKILLTDLSKCNEDCQLKTLQDANDILKKELDNSVLCLLDITNSETTVNVNYKLNTDKAIIKNKIKAQAVVGCQGIQHWIASIFMPGIHCFETREEAIDWLVKEEIDIKTNEEGCCDCCGN